MTSYDELVLAARTTDAAHSAFTKLFVETAHDTELGAVTAAKRQRSAQDQEVFVATFVTGDNGETAPRQFLRGTRRQRGSVRVRQSRYSPIIKPRWNRT